VWCSRVRPRAALSFSTFLTLRPRSPPHQPPNIVLERFMVQKRVRARTERLQRRSGFEVGSIREARAARSFSTFSTLRPRWSRPTGTNYNATKTNYISLRTCLVLITILFGRDRWASRWNPVACGTHRVDFKRCCAPPQVVTSADAPLALSRGVIASPSRPHCARENAPFQPFQPFTSV